MPGIEPGAFHMRSERSTTELHPLINLHWLKNAIDKHIIALLKGFLRYSVSHISQCKAILKSVNSLLFQQHIKFTKVFTGDAGDRTRGLSHAKRTLYH